MPFVATRWTASGIRSTVSCIAFSHFLRELLCSRVDAWRLSKEGCECSVASLDKGIAPFSISSLRILIVTISDLQTSTLLDALSHLFLKPRWRFLFYEADVCFSEISFCEKIPASSLLFYHYDTLYPE